MISIATTKFSTRPVLDVTLSTLSDIARRTKLIEDGANLQFIASPLPLPLFAGSQDASRKEMQFPEVVIVYIAASIDHAIKGTSLGLIRISRVRNEV